MMTSVTMALGLLAVTGTPTFAEPEDVTAQIESHESESYELDSYEMDSYGVESYGDSDCDHCGGCSHCGHGHLGWKHHCLKWRSPCNLSQHIPYYPASHGYYYFRPYNYINVIAQAQMVQRWKGDPRNPYSNDLFQRVYDEVEAVQDKLPLEVDSPEDLAPPQGNSIPRSTRYEPALLLPGSSARKGIIRRVRPAHFEE